MKKFKFELEKILEYRDFEKQQAEGEFAKALAVETEIQNNLKKIAEQYAALDKYMSGSLDFSDMVSMSQNKNLLNYQKEELLKQLAQAKLVSDQKREVLKECMKKTTALEKMKEILGRIKALGVKIALDDFGTGYSSLNHIREIPVDVIKVDQSFVKDLAEDAYSQSFIKMVAELGEAIGVSICVEGIETIEQYNALKDMKVKYIQGFYFDRPMKREAFEEKYISGLANKSKTM